ncbi:MAG: RNA binding S1 protein [Candidatus Berkelbacteria bacterium Licking1014_7]|uniref:RNA binding S1 protein n=1 Tax=Candidatus Berkelbacteria bacterium Licking1014_7 TaxID=2017147 RepID=A0A554LIU9_9BACT|nr:MAG: RNA binding S1 protein [Candidatus Berkelbacteria bacterium Licking1014_7]
MTIKKIKTIATMNDLADAYGEGLVPFTQGETIEVKIIAKTKSHLLTDVAGVMLGIVPESEFSYDIDELKPGDTVLSYVLLQENEDGYVVLSLKRADKDRVWETLQTKKKNNEALSVKVSSANRGGLIIEFGGIDGFIPVSQLAPAHYPKVEGADGNKIFSRLRKLVGQNLKVKVLNLDQKNNKLIFSEKSATNERLIEISNQLKTGCKLKAEITGIVDFGIFVKIDLEDDEGKTEKIDGLVHISEISWNKEENWKTKYKPGQKIEVAVVSAKAGRISLSLKRLEKDPWEKIIDQYQPGAKVTAEITRLTPFGAFVKMNQQFDALVHISQIDKRKLKSIKEGEKYDFYILSIDKDAHRINLTMKKATEKKETPLGDK